MPARWQTWFPFYVDAFRGSPSVQAMAPAARAGYLYLLGAAWQSEDCTTTADPMELAELSGLGDELWATHGPRILRKFDRVGDRLRNSRLYADWLEAKRIYDSRKNAAARTNLQCGRTADRSVTEDESNGDRAQIDTVSDGSPTRSAFTRTVTKTPTDTGEGQARKRASVPRPSRSQNPEFHLAEEVLDKQSIAADKGLVDVMGKAIRYIARDRQCDLNDASEILRKCIDACQLARLGPINAFWFTDNNFWREMCLTNGR